MTARILLLVVVCASAAPTTVAHAQDARARALELGRQSREQYQAGHFDEAARLLVEAYGAFPEPTLLYNLARAYEGAGEVPQAIDAYERYLAQAGEIPDRGAITARLETLHTQLRQSRAAATPPPREEHHEPRSRPREEVTSRPAPSVDPVPWVVGGVGVLGIVAAIVVGSFAQDAHATAFADPVQASAVAHQQDAYDLASAANVTFAIAGALALAGVIWGIVSLTSPAPRGERAEWRPVLRF